MRNHKISSCRSPPLTPRLVSLSQPRPPFPNPFLVPKLPFPKITIEISNFVPLFQSKIILPQSKKIYSGPMKCHFL